MSRFAVSGPRFRHLRCVAVSASVDGAGYLADLLLALDGLLLLLAVKVLLPVNLWVACPLHGRVMSPEAGGAAPPACTSSPSC